MRRYILISFVAGAPSAWAAGALGARVSACVRWLSSSAVASLQRAPEATGYPPTRHNRRVLRAYERAQDFELWRFGPEHSELTRYVSVLPELVELFHKRDPEGHRLHFVINSGDEPLYSDNGRDRRVYPRNDVLAVWRDSHLVFRHVPGAVLEHMSLKRTPEKLLMRAISKIDSGLD